MKKKLANFVRVLLAFLILAGVAMCALWLPWAVFGIVNHLDANAGLAGAEVTMAVLGLCAVVILPVFAIFILAFAFPKAIETDTLFSLKTGKLLKAIGIILVADCALFCGLLTIMLFLNAYWQMVAPFLFIGILGITVGSMLLVLSKYVALAAALKEEADGTL